jgi:hypothetical protein
MRTVVVYKTSSGSVYVDFGDDVVYVNGERVDSPIVGSTDPKNADKVHLRMAGYKELITPEICVGRCIVRDDPENRPYAGVSSAVKDIRVIKTDNDDNLQVLRELLTLYRW